MTNKYLAANGIDRILSFDGKIELSVSGALDPKSREAAIHVFPTKPADMTEELRDRIAAAVSPQCAGYAVKVYFNHEILVI